MDKYTATELAFKNGYEKGYEAAKAEIVYCKDCTHYCSYDSECDEGHNYYTEEGYREVHDNDFCSYGERIVKPNISKRTADALNKMGKAVHGGNDG